MRHAFILLGALLGLAACDAPNHGLGNHCRTLTDCDRPLLCSNRDLPDGSLGVCVLEEALGEGPVAALPVRAILRQSAVPVSVFWAV